MKEKKCLICGMNINIKNMLFNKHSFLKGNAKDNIIVCPFCGAGKEYLIDSGEKFEVDINLLDNQSLSILNKAMKLEIFNGEFYQDASKLADNDNIKKVFKDLSNVEFMHAKVHKNLGGFKNLPDLNKPDYSRYDTELQLLKEARNREEHAVAFYNKNINLISNSTIREILKAFVEVENQHIILADNFSDRVG